MVNAMDTREVVFLQSGIFAGCILFGRDNTGFFIVLSHGGG
jgi:hypothetical protein